MKQSNSVNSSSSEKKIKRTKRNERKEREKKAKKKSNKNLWLSILIGALGAGGQATTSNARSQQQQRRHSKGIITGIDVYYIELYILDLLLIPFLLLLREEKKCCCCCRCPYSCFHNNFTIDTVFRNKIQQQQYSALAVDRCNCKNNERRKTECIWDENEDTATKEEHNVKEKRRCGWRREMKKKHTESEWYAKEMKLFILYGADKKRPFTHSATNKVICSE